MELSAQIDLACDLVLATTGDTARSISPLTRGEVGRVFRADTGASSYLVKLASPL